MRMGTGKTQSVLFIALIMMWNPISQTICEHDRRFEDMKNILSYNVLIDTLERKCYYLKIDVIYT